MEIKAAAIAVSSRPEMYGASALNSAGKAAPSASPANDSATAGQAAAIYISPVIRFDQLARLAVIYYRDADTGETRDQIPPKKIVEEYRRNGGRNLGEFARTSAEKAAGPIEAAKVSDSTGTGPSAGAKTSGASAGSASTGESGSAASPSAAPTATPVASGGDALSVDASAIAASSAGSSSSGSVVSLTV